LSYGTAAMTNRIIAGAGFVSMAAAHDTKLRVGGGKTDRGIPRASAQPMRRKRAAHDALGMTTFY